MITTSLYNCESYSFARDQRELDDWLERGPHPGEPAPDLRAAIRLRLLERGRRSAVRSAIEQEENRS